MWISCVILALAAGGYALWPLFTKTFVDDAGQAKEPTETDADYLTARKSAIYRNIKELEFEFKMGRLAEADFLQLEAEYKSEAAEILHKLDALNAPTINPEQDARSDACPACGARSTPNKKFCADCGARLQRI